LKIAQPGPEVLRRSHSDALTNEKPETFRILRPHVSALWEIQFNLLIGAVREFGLLNPGAASTTAHTNATDANLVGRAVGGLDDEPASLQLLTMMTDSRIEARHCILLAHPDGRSEKKKKKAHTHTHTASQATKPEDRSRALAGISI
jgi:hypothetical protein